MKEFSMDGFTLLRFGAGEGARKQAGKVLYILCFDREDGERVGKRLAPLCQTICVIKEEGDFSPWAGESLWPGEKWGGGAGELLSALEKRIIPAAEEEWHLKVEHRLLAGYSLAGLCAMYAAYVTGCFDAFACVSGSLWYEGWIEFAAANVLNDPSAPVYISVGSKEKNTRNPRMARVEDSMQAYMKILKEQQRERPVIFELNPGTHFTDPEGRIRKGAEWLLTQQTHR